MIKKQLISFIIIAFFIIPSINLNAEPEINTLIDLDPLTDVKVTFDLLSIRSLEKDDNHINFKEYIDKYTAPDFYVKIFINDEVKKSKIWFNTRYIYEPDFSFEVDVPDDEELVNIKIQLWDWDLGLNKPCDISSDPSYLLDGYDVEVTYSIKYGAWWGDDHTENEGFNSLSDPSGYGRLNGCDDGSIYQHERDCELQFNIYQNDFDNDGIPFWAEENVFHTDPMVDDSGRDDDNDLIPYEWEYKWGHYTRKNWHSDEINHYWIYDPFSAENHTELDPDEDALNNYEEYLTSQWGSDPFRRDLFVELDEVEGTKFPEESKELLRTVYNRRNLVYHLDDGCMGGHDIIPYDEVSTGSEVRSFYNDYFLQGNEHNWRKGIFHYGVLTNDVDASAPGYCFLPDAYQISSEGMKKKALWPNFDKNTVYASCYMHECGHTLGIFNGNTPGCDDPQSGPFQKNWLKWRPYKSVMNYGYIYRILDYSDGSRGRNDFDDWSRIDLSFFQNSW